MAKTVAESTYSEHVSVWQDQTKTHRWIEIICPPHHAEAEEKQAMCAAVRRDLAREGIRLDSGQIERIVLDSSQADIHHCDQHYLSFAFHALQVETVTEEPLALTKSKIELIVGGDYLVTVWTGPVSAQFELLRHIWQHEAIPHADGALAFLFTQIVKTIITGYHEVLDQVPEKLFQLEKLVSASGLSQEMQETSTTIFHFNRTLLDIRRYFGPVRRVLDRLCELAEEEHAELQPFPMKYSWLELYDLRTQVEHLIELVDTYRDTVTNVFGAYQSSVSNGLAEISNRMNQVMQRLTIIATILTTGSVITGFYGMNLKGMGIGSEFASGALIMLCALLAVSVLEFWFFKRNRWI